MRKGPYNGANGCDAVRDEGKSEQSAAEHNSLRIADLCEPVQEDATKSESEGAGTRTQDQRIKSPLLYQLSYRVGDGSKFT